MSHLKKSLQGITEKVRFFREHFDLEYTQRIEADIDHSTVLDNTNESWSRLHTLLVSEAYKGKYSTTFDFRIIPHTHISKFVLYELCERIKSYGLMYSLYLKPVMPSEDDFTDKEREGRSYFTIKVEWDL